MKIIKSHSSAIDTAFVSAKSPVFIVERHGRRRRFLSRSAALNNLIHFMVTGTFDKAGIPTHEPSTPAIINGHKAERRGELTEQYWNAFHRTYRRVMKLLAHQREIVKWHKKLDALKSQHAELLSNKPI